MGEGTDRGGKAMLATMGIGSLGTILVIVLIIGMLVFLLRRA